MKFLFTVLLVLLTSGHSVLCYIDTCDYSISGEEYLCGNICLYNWELCECGDQKITRGWADEYCCASDCTNTTTGVKCSDGQVLNWDSPSPCNATGRCWNDVLKSQHLSYEAQYTCQDKCILWREMIDNGVWQGVSLCPGDQEICTPQQLRCPPTYSLHNMSTSPVRSYCYDDDDFRNNKKNGSYDLMDRSDENITRSSETRAQSINYTALTPCNSSRSNGEQSVNCDRDCVNAAYWCNDKWDAYCQESGVNTNDPVLCSDETLWQNISCDWTLTQFYPGVRCTGTIKHCRYPRGRPSPNFPTTCRDKSDRVFTDGEPCPDTPGDICHESCLNPGANCTACSGSDQKGSDYWICAKTNQCFHQDLKCDGIVQCEGVDENLDECKDEYRNNDENLGRYKIYPYATFLCNRTSNLETYAIACDTIIECNGGEDEQDCNKTSDFIKYSLASVAIMYLILKYVRKVYRKIIQLLEHKTHKVIKSRNNETWIIRNYFTKHDDDTGVFEDLNILLLNTIFTKTYDEIKVMGRYIYSLEEVKHKGDKNEIFACMHRSMDQLVMQTVIESKFKGLTEKTIEFLESCCGRWITISLDYIRAHEWLTDLLNTIKRLVKIELQYLDIVKDSFLTYSLYRIVGGHLAIMEFYREFSIVVVLCLATSVVVPVIFATLHLVAHNPFLIFTTSDKGQTGWRIAAMILVCCCTSFINPILLLNNYEGAKEKTRKMAKDMDKNTIEQIKKTKEIKEQWTSFVIIELGIIKLQLVFTFNRLYV